MTHLRGVGRSWPAPRDLAVTAKLRGYGASGPRRPRWRPTRTPTPSAPTLGSTTNTTTATAAPGEENPANNVASATVLMPVEPSISSPAFGGGKFSFSLPTELGVNYVVEYTDDLTAPDWTLLTTIQGTGGPVPVEDTSPPIGERYYRTRLVAP